MGRRRDDQVIIQEDVDSIFGWMAHLGLLRSGLWGTPRIVRGIGQEAKAGDKIVVGVHTVIYPGGDDDPQVAPPTALNTASTQSSSSGLT